MARMAPFADAVRGEVLLRGGIQPDGLDQRAAHVLRNDVQRVGQVEVQVEIDEARQHQPATGVDHVPRRSRGRGSFFRNRGDPASLIKFDGGQSVAPAKPCVGDPANHASSRVEMNLTASPSPGEGRPCYLRVIGSLGERA